MWRQGRNPKFYLMILTDAALFAAALIIAFFLRLESHLTAFHRHQIASLLPLMVGVKTLTFLAMGLYRGMWRYTSLRDIIRIAYASILACAIILSWLVVQDRFGSYSRAIMILDTLLTFLFAAGLRATIRLTLAGRSGLGGSREWWWPRARIQDGHRVLIVGAGDAGEKILREVENSPHLRHRIIGFVDDAPGKAGRTPHGLPIFGPVEQIPDLVRTRRIQEIWIVVPSASGPQMRRIVELCESADIPHKTLPGLGSIIDGRVTVQSLRKVDYEDLLGRPIISLDTAGITGILQDKIVLVTGCGGSIGSELCRQIVRYRPRKLILWDASEANLYQIQMQLHHEIRFHDYVPVLGPIQQHGLLHRVFTQYQPDIVFHAAAYKHVPLLEQNPWDAVLNNIQASEQLMRTARETGTPRFVLVSTDKAVRPTNVMGASKRATEIILHSLCGGATRFMAVRFGNVLGSAGSVIPLFQRQIEHGGPVTITHPEVTRYFMTIPEAAQLILQAGSMAQGGELFLLDMGTPIRIADMARDLIRLSGKEPDVDIPIVFTGIRPGEKLYEELITEGEGIVATPHEKIRVLRPDQSMHATAQNAMRNLEALIQAAGRYDAPAIRSCLQAIVPEYTPNDSPPVLNA